jgi:hypothetical protein
MESVQYLAIRHQRRLSRQLATRGFKPFLAMAASGGLPETLNAMFVGQERLSIATGRLMNIRIW